MALREDIRLAAAAEIDAKAAEDHDERGCGSGVVDHFDGPRGEFSGYTVTVELDNGLRKVFPRVDTTEKPDSIETHGEYAEELLAEIRKRRSDRKQLEAVEATKVR